MDSVRDTSHHTAVDGESIEVPGATEAREASKLHHARAGCFAKLKNYEDAEEESRPAAGAFIHSIGGASPRR